MSCCYRDRWLASDHRGRVRRAREQSDSGARKAIDGKNAGNIYTTTCVKAPTGTRARKIGKSVSCEGAIANSLRSRCSSLDVGARIRDGDISGHNALSLVRIG